MWPADRFRSTRTAASLPRRSCPVAHTRSKSLLSTKKATGICTCETSSSRRTTGFYVGMADLTVSEGRFVSGIDGPACGRRRRRARSTPGVDGRFAFFVNGKFGDHWKLTASADTREGRIDDLFSNFMDKDPQALFRRIDPDYYYPTFGDDSTVEEMAPTMGKFYVRLSQRRQLRPVGQLQDRLHEQRAGPGRSRGLYGANLHYQSDAHDGVRRPEIRRRLLRQPSPGRSAAAKSSVAPAGRSTSCNRQDILQGSERVRVEIRDKASGLVTGVAEPDPGTRLRHRLPAGSHRADRAVGVDRR